MKDDAIELLKTLLKIRSVNSKDDESAVAEFLCEYFQSHGVASSVQRLDEKRANVIADIPGENAEQTEIWNGHLDTVPYGDTQKWNTDPAIPVEEDGKIFARGASDMKSGLAAMVYALTHLEHKPARSIRFIGSCDEEKNGYGAEAARREALPRNYSFLLIGEPTNMRLGVAHKGCLWLKLRIKGKTGHGAYPEVGVNAIHYGYQLALSIKDYVYRFHNSILGTATAQIDMINGGTVPNMTADNCELVMDIRMVPGLSTEMIIAHAENEVTTLRKDAPELCVEFDTLNNRRAFDIKEGEPHLLGLKKILRAKGYEGDDIGINFFTDASVIAKDEFNKNVLLFGPGDPSLAHQPNEYVEIPKYLDAIEILKQLACMKE